MPSDRDRLEHVVQLVGQFRRQRREIIDEIERVLDLVCDAGGELAERSQLLGLDQAILRGAEVIERSSQLPRAGFDTFEQANIFDRDGSLVGKSGSQLDLLFGKRPRLGARHNDDADRLAFAQHRHSR